jgi:hypothetical protein
MSPTMTDIREFARVAWEDFDARRQTSAPRFQLDLTRTSVENAVLSAFYASMQSDEGRFPCVTLMSYKEDAIPAAYIPLAEPIDVTADQIAKLSHAVSRDSHIFCTAKNGTLKIGGLHVNELYEGREFGYAPSRKANPLKITIRGPGYIEVSCGGIANTYNAGILSDETLLYASQAMRRVAESVTAAMQEQGEPMIEAVEIIFNDLIKAITRLGHGGIVLFADKQKADYFTTYRQSAGWSLQFLLIQYWRAAAAMAARIAARGLPSSLQAIWTDEEAVIIAARTATLEKAIREIARLSGMDGAIAMNYDCTLFAFNAIINKAENKPASFRFLDDRNMERSYEYITKNRGSRHQACLSYVMTVPNSVAFVVSQDGQVSAFHRVGENTIVCERGMRVME